MHGDRLVELRLGGAGLDRDAEKLRQFTGTGADHMAADHTVIGAVDDQFHEYCFVAARERVFERTEAGFVDIDGGAMGPRILLAHADGV